MDYTSANDVPLETRFSYDALHRQTIAARTVSGAQSWGNTVTSYAADQTVTTPPFPEPIVTATIDAWGRSLVSREDSQNDLNHSQLNYGYDPLGRVTSVADDAGHTDSYVYDLGGRRTSSTDADAGTTATEYDAVGNVTKTTDAYGVAVSTTYDEINRPLAVSTVGHASAPTFPGGQLAGYTYDSSTAHGLGMLATSTVYDLGNTGNAWTTTVNSYDADGRLLSQTSAIPAVSGLSGTTNYTVSTSYLADGSPASVSYPAIGDLPAETVNVGYEDSAGSTGLPTSLTGPVTSTASYNQQNRLSGRTFGSTSSNGYTIRAYAYDDPLERLSKITTSVPHALISPGSVQDDSYSYDNADNVTDVIDGTIGANQQTCFNYDGLDRLIKAWTRVVVNDHCATYDSSAHADPAGFNQQFTYANDGAPATRTDLGGAAMSFTAAATGHPHAISAFNGNTFGYDTVGRESSRTVGGVTTTMSWDPLNHLYQSASPAGATAYVNNTDGSRLARMDPDGSTTLWVGPDELHVAAGSITGTRYYTLGGTTVAMKNASGLRWLSNDTQDSRQLAINASTGAVTRTYYTPYGAQRDGAATLPTDQGFLGHVVDQGTGLVQDGARYYDPSIGQFLTPDPLANAADNKSLDPYGYAANNPEAFVDPSGLVNSSMGGGGCGSLSLSACAATEQAAASQAAQAEAAGGTLARAVYENKNGAGDAWMWGYTDLAKFDAGLPMNGPGLMQAAQEQDQYNAIQASLDLMTNAIRRHLDQLPTDLLYGFVGGAVAEGVGGILRAAGGIIGELKAARAAAALGRASGDDAAAGAGAATSGASSGIWSVDSLSASGSRLVAKDLTRAGQELAKHSGQGAFPVASGAPATISRLGQEQLEDILTSAGTRAVDIVKGNFAGGRYYIAPDGRGAAFDSSGVFQYFGVFK